MKIITIIAITMAIGLYALQAQTIVEKSLPVSGENMVDLDFKFAKNIRIIPWNEDDVKIKVTVNINNNHDNDIFKLDAWQSSGTLRFFSITDKWEERMNERRTIAGVIFRMKFSMKSLCLYGYH